MTATGSTGTALYLQAIQSGSAGNTIPTTTTWTAATFGAGDLTGATDAGTYSTHINVYDSLGNSHVLTFNFTKSSAGNWAYQITIPAADVGGNGAIPRWWHRNIAVWPERELDFARGECARDCGQWVGGRGKNHEPQLATLQFARELRDYPDRRTFCGVQANAEWLCAGTLQSYSIGSSGVIDGVLSNGQTVSLGQIALATFANYDGLTNLGSNDYQTSLASGAASVAAPGTGGSGTLDGGRWKPQRGHRDGVHHADPGRTRIRGQCQGHYHGRRRDAGLDYLNSELSLRASLCVIP